MIISFKSKILGYIEYIANVGSSLKILSPFLVKFSNTLFIAPSAPALNITLSIFNFKNFAKDLYSFPKSG